MDSPLSQETAQLFYVVFNPGPLSTTMYRSQLNGSGAQEIATSNSLEGFTSLSVNDWHGYLYHGLATVGAWNETIATFSRRTLTGQPAGDIAVNANWVPDAEVDAAGGMIYWANVNTSIFTTPPTGSLMRAGLDGSGQQIIVPFLDSPHGIAISQPDHDGDGCASAWELSSSAAFGGQRDPKSFWDFFDTPATARDATVSGIDFFAVLARFGSSGDNTIDPLSTPPPAPAYHTAFDRGMVIGLNPWNVAPADGSITGTDFFTMLSQFGQSCA